MNDNYIQNVSFAVNNGKIDDFRALINDNYNIENLINSLSTPKLPDDEILQQIDQILNFDKNFDKKMDKVGNLFRIYNKVLKNSTSDEFKLSLLTSEVFINCIEIQNTFPYTSPYKIDKGSLENLKLNNSDSFLIVPIHGYGHTFAVALRRIEEGFSAVIINRDNEWGNYREKDDRYYEQYEEFLFNENNSEKLLDAINGPRLSDPPETTTLTIYQKFRTSSDENHTLNIKSRIQIQGNCFIKEPESAIQYIFATRNFTSENLKELRNQKDTFKPKWEPSTENFRKSYLKQQVTDNPHLKEQIVRKYNRYIKDKNVRVIVSAARNGDAEKVKELMGSCKMN